MRHTRTVAFHTLGCKLNFSETSTLARSLEDAGYGRVRVEDRPDVFVLNTCSVTENADKECRRHVRRFRSINADGFIVVIGCYAQLKPQEIAAIPGVDLVLGANEKFDLATHLDGISPLSTAEGLGVRRIEPASESESQDAFARSRSAVLRTKPGMTGRISPLSTGEGPGVRRIPTGEGPAVLREGVRRIFTSPIKEVKRFIPSYSANDRTRTFLKVQDGCDYFCSFCTIPLARGRSRSGSIDETRQQVHKIAASGVREIVLTGVNTGDFGRSHNESFLQLIKALDQLAGIDRFRISSIEPNLCSDGIIDFVAASNKFAPHFHIPLQSGSDVILQRMRRRYDTTLYRQRVERIKQLMPHACIGVDVITGTPGETEEEFLKTHEFLRSIPVDYLHVFTYSERANTTAVRMEDAVPMEVRRERTKQLRILSSKMQRSFYQRHQGTERPVLFEHGEQTSVGSRAADPAVHATPAGSPFSSGDRTSVGSRAADPAAHATPAGSPPSSGDPTEVWGARAAHPAVHATPAGSPPSSGDPTEVMEGYTDNYIRVTLPYDPDLVNTIVPVHLEKINGDGHMEGSIKEEAFSTSNSSTSNIQLAV